METTFENAKFLFYTGLRTDELVQNLGTERVIRDLVETMTVYMNHAIQANYPFQRQKKENVGSHLDDLAAKLEKHDNPEIKELFGKVSECFKTLLEKQTKSMILDFADVQAIAYSVGTYRDERSWLQKTLTAENPLDAKVREYAQHYDAFRQTGQLRFRYFDEDVVPHIAIAANPDMQKDLRTESWSEMFKKCCNYVNRQGTLLKLADKRDSIHSYYADESWNKLKRGFKDHDWSWTTTNWKEERLSRRQTKEVAGYFQRQAEVDGILFRTLYLACLRLQGDPNPEEATERSHQSFMDNYKAWGITDAAISTRK